MRRLSLFLVIALVLPLRAQKQGGGGGSGAARSFIIGSVTGSCFGSQVAYSGSTFYGCIAGTWTAFSAASTVAWSAITGGTLASQALLVGNSASLGPTGTGTISANQINGGTVPASAVVLGSNASNQPIAATTTGSGSTVVLATSPTLITPNLGTPSALTLTNATGLPLGGISATGTPSSTTFLRGDGTWSAGAGGGVSSIQFDSNTALTGAVQLVSGIGLSSTQAGQAATLNVNTASSSLAGIVALTGDLGGTSASPLVSAVHVAVSNDTTTGTTVNTLAKIVSTGAIIAATSDTTGSVGIVTAGAGKTGSATIGTAGIVSCQFDATAVTVGDWVQISSVTAGDCHDAGATIPTSGEIVGKATSGGAASTVQSVMVHPMLASSSGSSYTAEFWQNAYPSAATNVSPTAGDLALWAVDYPNGLSVANFTFGVTTADATHNAALCVFGPYTGSGSASLVASTAAATYGTTGNQTVASSGGTKTLAPGIYFVGLDLAASSTLNVEATGSQAVLLYGNMAFATGQTGACPASITQPTITAAATGNTMPILAIAGH